MIPGSIAQIGSIGVDADLVVPSNDLARVVDAQSAAPSGRSRGIVEGGIDAPAQRKPMTAASNIVLAHDLARIVDVRRPRAVRTGVIDQSKDVLGRLCSPRGAGEDYSERHSKTH